MGPDEILQIEGHIDTDDTKREIIGIFVEFVCEALGERKLIASAAYENTEKFNFKYVMPKQIGIPNEGKSSFLLPQDYLLTHGLSPSIENESYTVKYSVQISVNFTKNQML